MSRKPLSSSVYLDGNASTPMRPQAVEAVCAGMELQGNPHSVHQHGRRARAALEEARHVIAMHTGAAPADVIFTSGASEANHLALSQTTGPVLTSSVEHASVIEAREAVRIGVDSHGRIDPDRLAGMLDQYRPTLVSIMLANNETGVIEDIGALAPLIREAGALFHVDAVQALGRIRLDINTSGADLISLSAHKIGGPKGVGALVLREGVEIEAVLRGGGQEQRRRAGTENVAGAMGFAAALSAIPEDEPQRLEHLRDKMEAALADEAVFPGQEVPRTCNCSAVAMPGVPAALQVMRLDLEGICVSAGAACSSGKVGRSHVLEAMGLVDDVARSTIRVSLGWNNSEADIERFVDAWRAIRTSLSASG